VIPSIQSSRDIFEDTAPPRSRHSQGAAIFERGPRPDARRAEPAHPRQRWGRPTAAAFRPVAELEAAGDDDELEAKLGPVDRERLEELGRQGYADGHEQGLHDGLKEGWETGYAQARAEITARFAPALAALTQAADRLQAADAITLEELNERATAFALDIARDLIGHHLAAAADPGAEAIGRAIALAPDRGDLVVRLHPADIDALGDIDGLVPGREVTIVADAGVQPGGCLLEVGACRIDAQIGPALERVRRLLDLPADETGAVA
jgi:flagellar assembly protein FliH